jgi:hypothetical protein
LAIVIAETTAMTSFGNANGSILRWGDTPSFGLKQRLEKVPQA